MPTAPSTMLNASPVLVDIMRLLTKCGLLALRFYMSVRQDFWKFIPTHAWTTGCQQKVICGAYYHGFKEDWHSMGDGFMPIWCEVRKMYMVNELWCQVNITWYHSYKTVTMRWEKTDEAYQFWIERGRVMFEVVGFGKNLRFPVGTGMFKSSYGNDCNFTSLSNLSLS